MKAKKIDKAAKKVLKFDQRTKKKSTTEGRSPSQELKVWQRSGPYLQEMIKAVLFHL